MAFERLIHLRLRQPVWCFFWCRCWRVRRPLGALCGWSRRKRCGSNRAAQFSFAYMVSEHELPHVRISAGAGQPLQRILRDAYGFRAQAEMYRMLTHWGSASRA